MLNATVDKVLKKFTKVVDDLEAIAEQQNFEADHKEEQAEVYRTKAVVFRKEADRAEKLSARFKDLIAV